MYPVHDVIIFKLKSSNYRKTISSVHKIFHLWPFSMLAIFGKNFVMGGVGTLSSWIEWIRDFTNINKGGGGGGGGAGGGSGHPTKLLGWLHRIITF